MNLTDLTFFFGLRNELQPLVFYDYMPANKNNFWFRNFRASIHFIIENIMV